MKTIRRRRKLEIQLLTTINNSQTLLTSNEIKKGITKYADTEIYQTLANLTNTQQIHRQKIENKYYYWKK